MKRLIALVGAFTIAGTAAFAHGGNEHVRGVVTNVSAQSVTVPRRAPADGSAHLGNSLALLVDQPGSA
jgi:hypothetical protein